MTAQSRFKPLNRLQRCGHCRRLTLALAGALLVSSTALAQSSATEAPELSEDEGVVDTEAVEPGALSEHDQIRLINLHEQIRNVDTTETQLQVAPNVNLKDVVPTPEPASANTAAAQTDDEAPQPGEAQSAGADLPVAHDPKSKPQPEVATDNGDATEAPVENSPQPAARADNEAQPLVILDKEAKPGTSTRLGWHPEIAMDGLSTTSPVLVINGARPGPNLCLTGAVHGDELNGIEIVRRLMYNIEPEKLSGRIIGVPIVNVQGFQRGSRYLPDRRDLNRHFPGDPRGSLASRIAYSLFNDVIRHCDMLVDIHTGSLRRNNLPQLRADMHNPQVAEFSKGFDQMAVVHSEGSAGMLRTAATEYGIVAITMEAGESMRIQENQIKAGVNSLNSLLEKQGMLSSLFVWGDPEPVYYDSTWIRSDFAGILVSDVALGEEVIAGQPLGVVTDPITNAQHTIRAEQEGRIIGMAVDQVVMAGFATYHLGTEARGPSDS